MYETRDLPYQSSASMAKGSTRSSQFHFDTPSIDKTSYAPSSPASFLPAVTEGEEDADEGNEHHADATDDGEAEDGGGLNDVTLPSDLTDLLGQLPEGEVGSHCLFPSALFILKIVII